MTQSQLFYYHILLIPSVLTAVGNALNSNVQYSWRLNNCRMNNNEYFSTWATGFTHDITQSL